MTIAWIYLDKRGASIDALKDYSMGSSFRANRRSLPRQKAPRVRSLLHSTGIPRAHNPHAGEARLAGRWMKSTCSERYRRALEYVGGSSPLGQHSEDEQFVPRVYLNQRDAVFVLRPLHHRTVISLQQKNRALARLTPLYGK